MGAEEVRLPFAINDTFVYREMEVLKLESKMGGFALKCNLRFNVCEFEVSGWYFGKTAGLWGTHKYSLPFSLKSSA